MFRKILVATDLSHASEEVICSLGGLKSLGTKKALLLRCLNIRDVGGLAGTLEASIEAGLERQRERVAALGFDTEAKVVTGLPQIEIEVQAGENDCSLIVIGSRGLSGLKEFLLGSVANAMLHHARRPILMLRVSGADEAGDSPCEPLDCNYLRNILFPTDFSDNAGLAYGYVRETAKQGAREITLLHVADVDADSQLLEAANSRLARISDELLALGAGQVTIDLVRGIAKREVANRLTGDRHSLAILGSQGRGYVSGAMLGSVSHAVAYRSAAPVLFVPVGEG